MHATRQIPVDQAFQPSGWWRYLVVAAFSFLVLTGSVLTVNLLVDPLWFGAGNRLTSRNFVFNERHAKVNLFRQDAQRYDCLVFGSSRSTLLNASLVAGHDCFNFALSGGLVGEFVVLAEYLRDSGVRPSLVIVGVDDFNFRREADLERLPEFIRRHQVPPGRLRTYLSFDVLDFSIQTLRDLSPMPRYYREDFVADIRPDAPVYRPVRNSGEVDPDSDGSGDPAGPPGFAAARLEDYARLRQVFSAARFIGYIPPVSAWEIEELASQKLMDEYLLVMHTLARSYDLFLDYSIPSEITWDITTTYDGSHYNLEVNRLIAEDLGGTGTGSGFGMRVDGIGLADYRHAHEVALARFRDLRVEVEAEGD